jgi:hypothetical protein
MARLYVDSIFKFLRNHHVSTAATPSSNPTSEALSSTRGLWWFVGYNIHHNVLGKISLWL